MYFIRTEIFSKDKYMKKQMKASSYRKVQEELRKDIENNTLSFRLVSILYERNFFCGGKKNIIEISGTYLIIHNMILWMNHEGEFEEANEYRQFINIATKVYA